MVFEDVKAFIDENIFHTASWDKVDEPKKRKAVKNAESVLYMLFKNYNSTTKPLPVEAVAYQTIWILSKDANVMKAEMGVSSMSIEGMSQSFSKTDRSVAPEVKLLLKKRVGSYSVNVTDTNRGMYT